jgi:hypothetical protein
MYVKLNCANGTLRCRPVTLHTSKRETQKGRPRETQRDPERLREREREPQGGVVPENGHRQRPFDSVRDSVRAGSGDQIRAGNATHMHMHMHTVHAYALYMRARLTPQGAPLGICMHACIYAPSLPPHPAPYTCASPPSPSARQLHAPSQPPGPEDRGASASRGRSSCTTDGVAESGCGT